VDVKKGNNMNFEQIAQIAHETNRAYCQSIGDNSQPPWSDAPEWQKQSAIKGVEFHMDSHAKGITPAPSASHESWLQEKKDAGWKYGTEKNPDKKEHPCFVPYEELPVEQRLKDYLFAAVAAAFAKCLKSETH
jgi:hypothetical protein